MYGLTGKRMGNASPGVCIPEKGASFFSNLASIDVNLPGQTKSGLNIR